MLVNLEEGVGLSLVSKLPEELVFAMLSGINVHFTRTVTSQVLELSVGNIQVPYSTNMQRNFRSALLIGSVCLPGG